MTEKVHNLQKFGITRAKLYGSIPELLLELFSQLIRACCLSSPGPGKALQVFSHEYASCRNSKVNYLKKQEILQWKILPSLELNIFFEQPSLSVCCIANECSLSKFLLLCNLLLKYQNILLLILTLHSCSGKIQYLWVYLQYFLVSQQQNQEYFKPRSRFQNVSDVLPSIYSVLPRSRESVYPTFKGWTLAVSQ